MKLLQYLQSNILTIFLAVVLIAVAVSHQQLQQEFELQSMNRVLQSKEEVANHEPDILLSELEVAEGVVYDPAGLATFECSWRLRWGEEPSSTFNPNNPYNLAFSYGNRQASYFQDINGDNLPDFVTNYTYSDNSTSYVSSEHKACVYLNNGNGWDKTYECFAITQISHQTGEVARGEYYGDCAG